MRGRITDFDHFRGARIQRRLQSILQARLAQTLQVPDLVSYDVIFAGRSLMVGNNRQCHADISASKRFCRKDSDSVYDTRNRRTSCAGCEKALSGFRRAAWLRYLQLISGIRKNQHSCNHEKYEAETDRWLKEFRFG